MREAASPRFADWPVPALVAAVQTLRLAWVARLPERELVGYLPDDAFYYLVMGRNFARLGRWTFDGTEPASGFHVAWGYLVALAYFVAPHIGLQAIFVLAGAVQIACMAGAAWLVCRTARRVFGAGGQAGVAMVFLSAVSLAMGLDLMETALVLLASAATLDLVCRTEAKPGRGQVVGAAALGFAGMLARSDFGLLPLVLFAMQLAMWRRRISSPGMVRLAGAVLAGSVAGLAAIALHTHWISAQWVQSSGRQKLFWSQTWGLTMVPAQRLLLKFFSLLENARGLSGHMQRLLGAGSWVLLAMLAVGLALTLRDSRRRWLVGGVCCAIAAYAWAYRYNSAELQDWYVGTFEAPVALLAAGAASWFAQRQRWLTVAAAALVCLCGVRFSLYPARERQRPLYDAGVYLRDHPELKPAGSWNAGIVGYFAGGGVTNIDGLVNDRILPYTQAGTLLDYVEQRRLRAIVDYRVFFSPFVAKRGGYANGELRRCVAEQDEPATRPGEETANPVHVFLLSPECVPR